MAKHAWKAVEAAKIAASRHFTVITVRGRCERDRADFDSLAEAQAYRDKLGRDEYGRGSVVYAVTDNGETIHVG